ncbi:WD40 repeat-like protein [Gloeophyllum trabeum ATCC 11539]|uniref:WD40 repeat-like protein n=1 Tax=Gloeophyllum trabeum (strain ATCC 11539 / FP-39264 / Madison 617) TaxID=670483 RepID=S7QEW1_GLOTA|nr:WD40 repeat-like protein [Gloeophyllum trabeum ATCC 11539]EPQ57967.1 WD40 repeat-like protein [Gloeophyllum trabeum ATCC 11539]
MPSSEDRIPKYGADSLPATRSISSDGYAHRSMIDSAAEAGPSSVGLDRGSPKLVVANGHSSSTKGYANGSLSPTNGVGAAPFKSMSTNGKSAASSISRVNLPGTTLYDDSFVDREEFVRLVIQSLRDVGYIESAATLEAESGYAMETPEVSDFRQCILEAAWEEAERALVRLGVTEEDGLWEAKFLISQQKYLELLEAENTTAALQVLRNEIAPLQVESDQLHSLSSLMMCSDAADLRQRAGWDGALGTSRRRLLSNLQRYIPSSLMIPPRRLSTLLSQSLLYQQSHCLYHNVPLSLTSPNPRSHFSLYMDHHCDREKHLPRATTAILDGHVDEVWAVEWSHCGTRLATAGSDRCALIWRIGPEKDVSARTYTVDFVLREHQYAVGYLAWSLDDSILLTASDDCVRMWNTTSGICIRVLKEHSDTVTSLAWLPDGTGFISGGLDRKIILWDVDGNRRDSWGTTSIRVTDLAVTPDFTRVVAVGMHYLAPTGLASSTGASRSESSTPPTGGGGARPNPPTRDSENRMIIYDLASKQTEASIRLDGETTSVKISPDSQYALINQAPDEIHLWDLSTCRIARKFTGQRQGRHVIRSCFGGVDSNFIVSGSEDGNVYIWHRDSGVLLEVLSGHGAGSVNSVSWNPKNERMFASCSDDHTIRIWEALDTTERGLPSTEELSDTVIGKGKGKSRERLNSHSDDGGSGSGAF